jgi:hypothetical protein
MGGVTVYIPKMTLISSDGKGLPRKNGFAYREPDEAVSLKLTGG